MAFGGLQELDERNTNCDGKSTVSCCGKQEETMVSSKYFLTPTQWLKNWEDTSWLIDIAQEPIHTYIYSHIYIYW